MVEEAHFIINVKKSIARGIWKNSGKCENEVDRTWPVHSTGLWGWECDIGIEKRERRGEGARESKKTKTKKKKPKTQSRAKRT